MNLTLLQQCFVLKACKGGSLIFVGVKASVGPAHGQSRTKVGGRGHSSVGRAPNWQAGYQGFREFLCVEAKSDLLKLECGLMR
jgi:hypothetical protein